MNVIYKLIILMPLYNREEYIAEALNSVFMQETNFEFKIIIIDDASTDNGLAIAKEYQKSHTNIEIIENETNSKLLKTILKGYENLDSEYFCVLDPDDYWTDKNKLQEAVDFLDAHASYSIYATNIDVLSADGTITKYVNTKKTTIISDFTDYLKNRAVLSCTQGTIFRNSIFKNGIPEKLKKMLTTYDCEPFRADSFRNAIHLRKGKALFVNKSTAVYRVTDTGIYAAATDLKNYVLNSYLFYLLYIYFDKIEFNFFINTMSKELIVRAFNSTKREHYKDDDIYKLCAMQSNLIDLLSSKETVRSENTSCNFFMRIIPKFLFSKKQHQPGGSK